MNRSQRTASNTFSNYTSVRFWESQGVTYLELDTRMYGGITSAAKDGQFGTSFRNPEDRPSGRGVTRANDRRIADPYLTLGEKTESQVVRLLRALRACLASNPYFYPNISWLTPEQRRGFSRACARKLYEMQQEKAAALPVEAVPVEVTPVETIEEDGVIYGERRMAAKLGISRYKLQSLCKEKGVDRTPKPYRKGITVITFTPEQQALLCSTPKEEKVIAIGLKAAGDILGISFGNVSHKIRRQKLNVPKDEDGRYLFTQTILDQIKATM